MKLYTVTFGENDIVEVEAGIALEGDGDKLVADLGTDVGGATLAMVSLRIPLVEAPTDLLAIADLGTGGKRLLVSGLEVGEEGVLAFIDPVPEDARALVVLSVIQRSPDARTEVEPYRGGVECVGNAFERPMDKQVLVMPAGGSVRFRRFGRGGIFGAWHTMTWNGSDLGIAATTP